MRAALSALVIAALVACALGTGAPNVSLPPQYTALRTDLSGEQLHSVAFALHQRNLDKLESIFWEVSDPNSPQYGKFLSQSELKELVAPPAAHVDALQSWIQDTLGDIEFELDVVRTGDVAVLRLPVQHLERLFGVRFEMFTNTMNGRTLVRSAVPLSMPSHIREIVQLVHGVNDFPVLKRTGGATRNAERAPLQPTGPPGTSYIRRASGTDGEIEVTFFPYCMSGNLSTSDGMPCLDDVSADPALVAQVEATSLISAHAGTWRATATLDVEVCSTKLGYTSCTVKLPLQNNILVNVSVQLVFARAGDAHVSYLNHPVVATAYVTPQKLNELYSIPDHMVVRNPSVATQCVVEFEQQYYSPDDLELFFKRMDIESAPVTVIGPNDESIVGVEANLDIQWIMGMAPGSPTVFWSIEANSTLQIDDILTWEYAIGNMTNPPLVNSLSYGMTESHVDKFLGQGYTARSDVEFQKLATLGLTVIIADGDTGCHDLGLPPMSQTKCGVFEPDWPSQSPYVTAIGSTYITPFSLPVCYMNASKGGMDCDEEPLGEVAVGVDMGMRWTTGGGFSNIESMPSYQKDVVQKWLGSDSVPPLNYFNQSGRAYPDASTVGHALMTAVEGSFITVDGTSASAPIFAGIVTLLNDARVSAGKSPLGFITQMMYEAAAKNAATFHDVTVGDNRCGAVGTAPIPECCPHGYKATRGWDPVTGLGTPNFERLRAYVLTLP